MPDASLHVSEQPARVVGELLAKAARQGESIVLTGGSAPAEAYTQAAFDETHWGKASVWWGDERCVLPGDKRSNYNLAERTLFDRLARLPEIHRMKGELPPAEAAAAYASELQGVELDLLLLGLGPDGHIASLFPGSSQLAERELLVTSGPAKLEPFVDRITLTLPALLSARRIVVLVSGDAKAEAVKLAFADPIGDAVPASLLRTGSAPLDVYLDPAAAQLL